MKRAVISDIHGNLESLEAVLEDIRQQGITEIFCLGDVIGYGPNPRECVELVMRCDVCLAGDYDRQAALDDELPLDARHWEFLNKLSHVHREDGWMFVHGSPCDPVNEYLFPEDVHNGPKMGRVFAEVPRCCFAGHTHVPGVFTEGLQFHSPEDLEGPYRLPPERKVVVNVGSVGQPRDGDPRACYAVLDDDRVSFRRVGYDFAETERKLRRGKG